MEQKVAHAKKLLAELIPLMQEIAEEVKCSNWEDCKQCPIYQIIDTSGMNLYPAAYKTLEYCEVF